MVSFKVTKADRLLIGLVVARHCNLAKEPDKQSVEMDITATHANGNKLDLAKLITFDDFNFTHDTCGIALHLNRRTGKLMNHFRPRCSL